MKKPTIHQLWGMLCAALILAACQKEASTTHDDQTGANNLVRATGALPENPALVAKVPLIISSDFYNSPNTLGAKGGGKGGRQTDSDGDGIKDASDACPTQKETINGYQDTDGCPDTAPAPTSTDSDGDGIADTGDGCPTQKETFNGYQDADGCPDTVPDTDGDGIVDTQDGCTTEKETVNGYQDSDGCPDTPPTVLPPSTLPASYYITMPPVQNQGAEFSCVALATATARSVEYFYKTNAASYTTTTNIFSPEYLYNQVKYSSDCYSGTDIYSSLNLIKNQGICIWQSMPYSSTNGCSLLPTTQQLSEAGNYKINNFSIVYQYDQAAIKTLLSQNHPLIAGTSIDNTFSSAGPGFIWKTFQGNYGTNHAYVLCGYDDARHAYKVMNSWGTGWGDAGYSWIDYDFFGTLPGSVYTINN